MAPTKRRKPKTRITSNKETSADEEENEGEHLCFDRQWKIGQPITWLIPAARIAGYKGSLAKPEIVSHIVLFYGRLGCKLDPNSDLSLDQQIRNCTTWYEPDRFIWETQRYEAVAFLTNQIDCERFYLVDLKETYKTIYENDKKFSLTVEPAVGIPGDEMFRPEEVILTKVKIAEVKRAKGATVAEGETGESKETRMRLYHQGNIFDGLMQVYRKDHASHNGHYSIFNAKKEMEEELGSVPDRYTRLFDDTCLPYQIFNLRELINTYSGNHDATTGGDATNIPFGHLWVVDCIYFRESGLGDGSYQSIGMASELETDVAKVLVVFDATTNWIILRPFSATNADELASILSEIFVTIGGPPLILKCRVEGIDTEAVLSSIQEQYVSDMTILDGNELTVCTDIRPITEIVGAIQQVMAEKQSPWRLSLAAAQQRLLGRKDFKFSFHSPNRLWFPGVSNLKQLKSMIPQSEWTEYVHKLGCYYKHGPNAPPASSDDCLADIDIFNSTEVQELDIALLDEIMESDNDSNSTTADVEKEIALKPKAVFTEEMGQSTGKLRLLLCISFRCC